MPDFRLTRTPAAAASGVSRPPRLARRRKLRRRAAAAADEAGGRGTRASLSPGFSERPGAPAGAACPPDALRREPPPEPRSLLAPLAGDRAPAPGGGPEPTAAGLEYVTYAPGSNGSKGMWEPPAATLPRWRPLPPPPGARAAPSGSAAAPGCVGRDTTAGAGANAGPASNRVDPRGGGGGGGGGGARRNVLIYLCAQVGGQRRPFSRPARRAWPTFPSIPPRTGTSRRGIKPLLYRPPVLESRLHCKSFFEEVRMFLSKF